MSQKHVILKASPEMSSEAVARGGPGTVAPVPLTIEIEDLRPHHALALSRSRDVIAVAPVIPIQLIAPLPMETPPDPLAAGSTWGVKAVGADTSPFSGAGTIVAVLDTGIDATHAAFAGVQLERRNFTSSSDDDEHGHGTHCAGTIFGRPVDGTRIGVAPGVSRALIGKVLGQRGGGSDSILQAIQWAANSGAHVVSMSLGIDFPGYVAELLAQNVPAELATSIALDAYRANVLLFERLASLLRAQSLFMQPTLLIAAAGNESRRDLNADFEIYVSPPAVSEGIVSVAALGDDPNGLAIAPFSNVGARVSGPGVGVLSAAMGGGLVSMSGTSMATPHVAGVAALWTEKLRVAGELSSLLLSDRLVASASTSPLKPGFDPQDVGAGLVRAPQN